MFSLFVSSSRMFLGWLIHSNEGYGMVFSCSFVYFTILQLNILYNLSWFCTLVFSSSVTGLWAHSYTTVTRMYRLLKIEVQEACKYSPSQSPHHLPPTHQDFLVDPYCSLVGLFLTEQVFVPFHWHQNPLFKEERHEHLYTVTLQYRSRFMN